MYDYEKLGSSNEDIYNAFLEHVIPNHGIGITSHTTNIDFTGKRVKKYVELCYSLQQINMIRIVLGGSYRQKDNVPKFVKFSPDGWKIDDIITVMKRVTGYFGKEINNRISDPDIMYSITTKLKTKLDPPQKGKENSQLIDHNLDLIFDDINNINTNN